MDDESTPIEPSVPTPDIQYEETPIITPVAESPQYKPDEPTEPETQVEQPESQTSTQSPVPPMPKKRSFGGVIKTIIIFMLLFVVGYVASGFIRNLISSSQKTTTAKTQITPTPIQTLEIPMVEESSQSGLTTLPITTTQNVATTASSVWKTYNPLHGSTRTALTSIQFQLPSTIQAPVCDGSSCGSQGTYLPGGTRFTVALRGTGEVLADFRGKVISDASGKVLTTTKTTIAGRPATEYTADNTGSTAGGYGFSAMHGYMIEVSDTLSFEINHFSPSGITTDFASDETVFKSIVATVAVNALTKTTTATASAL